ncbi:hypothetical protein TSUD_338870 [Trifolium subterraneum]|nr:hypothetical protein TSUD_338870 [Trifolium subterraneum]
MDAKTSCSTTNKDDHDDHQDSSEKPELDPSVENHDGFVLHEQYYDEPESSQDSSEEPELSLSVKKLNPVPKKKKLLVMSLNGFLLHRVYVYDKEALPKSRTDQYESLNFLLFKRPFSEEFMKFCLERFEVGIWSSAQKHNIDGALDLAIGEESKNKLLFVWDQSECTISHIKSKENNEKPVFFKPIESVWGEVKKGGPYSASNTLMIGDKPYKAYLNPKNTAIFIKSYDPDDKEDNALGETNVQGTASSLWKYIVVFGLLAMGKRQMLGNMLGLTKIKLTG